MAIFQPSRLGSNGKAGRILGGAGSGIDVHLDVIVSVKRSSEWQRTDASLEQGAALTVHRKRVPQTMVVDVQISDVAPDALAFLTGRWETDHTKKTLGRIERAQQHDRELYVWTGEQFERTPAGSQVWVLDNIDGPEDMAGERGSARLTLTFGESPRFTTLFTQALPNAAESLTDVLGGNVERGRQSTTSAAADGITPFP